MLGAAAHLCRCTRVFRKGISQGSFYRAWLDADLGNFLYVPNGLAHGFCVTSETGGKERGKMSNIRPNSEVHCYSKLLRRGYSLTNQLAVINSHVT